VYVTTPDNVWALDARSAHQLWRYTYPTNQGFHIGHRGAAVYKESVYLTTPDAHLLSLNAKDGKVKWDVVIADSKKGYWSTNAPLLIRDHLIVGVSGDFDNLPGILRSFDPETGKLQWTFYSTPPGATVKLSGCDFASLIRTSAANVACAKLITMTRAARYRAYETRMVKSP